MKTLILLMISSQIFATEFFQTDENCMGTAVTPQKIVEIKKIRTERAYRKYKSIHAKTEMISQDVVITPPKDKDGKFVGEWKKEKLVLKPKMGVHMFYPIPREMCTESFVIVPAHSSYGYKERQLDSGALDSSNWSHRYISAEVGVRRYLCQTLGRHSEIVESKEHSMIIFKMVEQGESNTIATPAVTRTVNITKLITKASFEITDIAEKKIMTKNKYSIKKSEIGTIKAVCEPAVNEVISALNTLGYLDNRQSTDLTEKVKLALIQFQMDHQLAIGQITDETMSYLNLFKR